METNVAWNAYCFRNGCWRWRLNLWFADQVLFELRLPALMAKPGVLREAGSATAKFMHSTSVTQGAE